MSTPQEQPSPAQQTALQNAMNTLLGIRMAIANMLIVHLGPARSVNLANVCSYEIREKAKLDKKGQPIIDEDGAEIGSGEFFPVVVMIGGSEVELSEEKTEDGSPSENDNFRTAWEQFASLNGQAMAIMQTLFPEPIETPPAA